MAFTPETAIAFFEEYFAPWVRALDVSFDAIDEDAGAAVLSIPITEEVTRLGDIISGQTLATLADTAMVFACAAHYGEMKPVATTNLDTQFLRPGTGARIRCEARVVRAGKALIFTEATMIAEPSGKEVAKATATFYVP